ncbi:hypothetical protein JHK87_043012 [Glycine soja]|nr:hypothetical protein JHK87_043012 [Glycine soja]
MAYSPTSKAKPTLDASSDEDDSHPEDTVNSYDEELKECEALKELPPEIVTLYEEIETLRDKLGEFLVVMKPLTRLLRCKETPKTNLAMSDSNGPQRSQTPTAVTNPSDDDGEEEMTVTGLCGEGERCF